VISIEDGLNGVLVGEVYSRLHRTGRPDEWTFGDSCSRVLAERLGQQLGDQAAERLPLALLQSLEVAEDRPVDVDRGPWHRDASLWAGVSKSGHFLALSLAL
jgi:hypothetical protein